MRDADMPRFAGMGENVMAALYTAQCPSIRFELLDNLLAVHGGYYNYQISKVNTITTTSRP